MMIDITLNSKWALKLPGCLLCSMPKQKIVLLKRVINNAILYFSSLVKM